MLGVRRWQTLGKMWGKMWGTWILREDFMDLFCWFIGRKTPSLMVYPPRSKCRKPWGMVCNRPHSKSHGLWVMIDWVDNSIRWYGRVNKQIPYCHTVRKNGGSERSTARMRAETAGEMTDNAQCTKVGMCSNPEKDGTLKSNPKILVNWAFSESFCGLPKLIYVLRADCLEERFLHRIEKWLILSWDQFDVRPWQFAERWNGTPWKSVIQNLN